MKPIMRILAGVALAAAAIVVLAAADWVLFRGLEFGGVAVPKPTEGELKVVTLDQGWSPELSGDYHRRSQGTKILPKAWFMELEAPSPDPLFPGVKLSSREYLSRFGFIYDPGATDKALPIGFADATWGTSVSYAVPPIKRPTLMVGLTCAACHTGRIDFDLKENKRLGVLIEGGSAMINLGKFQEAVGQALFWTNRYRLDSFVSSVNQSKSTAEAKEIKDDIQTYIHTGIASRDFAKEHKLSPVDAGFARTDALGLIGNRVFGPLNDENQSVTDAPVNFPHLWDTAWFDWVQYNASIRPPLARNVGEALGVGAAVKPATTLDEKYESTVDIPNLIWMEDVLGGYEPLAPWSPGAPYKGGLRPPRWDDLSAAVAKAGGLADPAENAAMSINPVQRDNGARLYASHCARCHLPPRSRLRSELNHLDSQYWETDARSEKKFLRLRVVDLEEIGTDPNQAVNFYRRFAVVPNPMTVQRRYGQSAADPDRRAIGYPRTGTAETISAEEGLYRVTSFLRLKYLEKNGLFGKAAETVDERRRIDRFRTLPIDPESLPSRRTTPGPEILLDKPEDIANNRAIDDVIRANLGYKARPLDGVWATPPFFHNGSVPNLDQVLRPADCRDKQFYLGSKRFDPVKVGYKTEHFPGASLMDTTVSGNRNTGHEFRDLTLEEFESALLDPKMPVDSDHPPSRASRWNTVLGIETEGLDDEVLKKAIHELTKRVLTETRMGRRRDIRNPTFLGVRGVIGPELSSDERRDLIEYLKSL